MGSTNHRFTRCHRTKLSITRGDTNVGATSRISARSFNSGDCHRGNAAQLTSVRDQYFGYGQWHGCGRGGHGITSCRSCRQWVATDLRDHIGVVGGGF